LKTENVLVTSSLSVYITDFASSFKQVYLPLNDPSDFNFYFGTSGRRTCYIAPERFYSEDSEIARQKAKVRAEAEANVLKTAASTGGNSNERAQEGAAELFKRDGKVTEAMDVFSLGCVIAELWRDGAPIFTLMQLFKYREGQFDIEPALAEIADVDIREMVRSMVSLQPSKRKKFGVYLDEARGQSFPEIFYTFLHRYLTTLQRTSPGATAMAAAEAAHTNSAALAVAAVNTTVNTNAPSTTTSDAGLLGASTNGDLAYIFRAEADERIERLYEEWMVVSQMLGASTTSLNDNFDSTVTPFRDGTLSPHGERTVTPFSDSGAAIPDVTNTNENKVAIETVLPIQLCIPGLSNQKLSGPDSPIEEDGPALLILSPLLANIRNAIRPSTKLHALDLLLHLSSRWLSDEAKLDRVLPYIISMFNDDSIMVRSAAVKSMVQLLSLVEMVTPSNALTFSEYIIPNLRPLTRDTSSIVRLTYAACIVELIEVGKSYLQMASAMRQEGIFAADVEATEEREPDEFFEGGASPEEAKFDRQMESLRGFFQEQATILLTDSSPAVKRVLLDNIGPLCSFFGAGLTNDILLSHMITFLNDRSWMLRQAFFDAIIDVAKVAGPRSIEDYILPLMLQALSDPEEFVVLRVLEALFRLLNNNSPLSARTLLTKAKVYDVVGATAGFLCHPNHWLRLMSAFIISTASTQVSTTDLWALVYPSIRPLLRCDIHTLEASNLLFAVQTPLSREVLHKAVQWASRSKSSKFWKSSVLDSKSKSDMNLKAGLSNGLGFEGIGMMAGRKGQAVTKTPIPRSEEDDAYLDNLRSSGLNEDDEVKLVGLREYIARLAKMSSLMGTNMRGTAGYSSTSINQEDANLLPPLQIKSGLAVQPLDDVTPLTIFFSSKAAGKSQTNATTTNNNNSTSTTGLEGGSIAAPGSMRSQAADSSFSGRMARRRLGGNRVASEMSYLSPLEELRRRMNETMNSDDDAIIAMPATPGPFDPNGLPSPSQRPGSPMSVTSGVGTVSHPSQAKLGLGKALPAIASHPTTATGTMSELSARLGNIDRVHLNSMDTSGKTTPAGSTSQTIRGGGAIGGDGNGATKGIQDDNGDVATFSSTYEGNDPYIRAHLEAIYFANFRDKNPTWTSSVASANGSSGMRRRGGRSVSSNPRAAMSGNSNRRPEGNLVAYFTEHTASITAIAVSPDHAFFLSGSEDGTIKVWDTARLEKNVTSKSRATYNGQKGKIAALIMLEGSHCAASAASDGSVHVIRVETSGASSTPSTLPRYGKVRLISNFQLSNPDEYVTCLLQSSSKSGTTIKEAASLQSTDTSTSSSSTLILATSKNRIIILDLRTMQVMTNFQIGSHLGSISTLCLDSKNIWILIGTIGGVMCLWDLRFHLLLKTWRIGGAEDKGLLQINSCILHPSRGKGKWVMIAYERLNLSFEGEKKRRVGETETLVETWDIDRAVCVELFESTFTTASGSTKDRASTTTKVAEEGAIQLDSPHSAPFADSPKEHAPPLGLESPAQGIERLVKMLEWSQDRQQAEDEKQREHEGRPDIQEEVSLPTASKEASNANSSNVKVLLAGIEGYSSSASIQSAQVSGGWLDAGRLAQEDARNANNNNQGGPAGFLITGGQDRKIRFWDLGKAEKSCCLGIKEERGEFKSSSVNGGGGGKSVQNRREGSTQHYIHQLPISSSSLPSNKIPLRSPLILHQQTNQINSLMKAHKDTITALGIIESPFRCIVAGDQAGSIRVWE